MSTSYIIKNIIVKKEIRTMKKTIICNNQKETMPAGGFRGGEQQETMPAGGFRGGEQQDILSAGGWI